MSDVNANIGINFDASNALSQLRELQAGLSKFNQALIQGNVGAMNAQKGLNDALMQAINASGKFSASQKMVSTSTASFTDALERNKLSLGQYFKFTAAAATANTKVFENAFSAERNVLNRARRDRVKALQTQYIQLSGAQDGLVKVLQVVPKHLEMVNGKYTDYATRVQMAAQRQQFLNQLLKQGSTQLLNFGKNTQWAGRQLMVGLTIPLSMLGSFAAKTFRDMEMAVIKFARVYGDITTSGDATNRAIEDIKKLGQEFTKYGVAVTDTMTMAADAAAMGLTGNALQQQIISATRLAVLGQVEQQQALETTISLQNAFGISSDQLAQKINFLNAVENQTVLSIEDLTIAIPKAGPVVKQLGGNVEDLAFFMTAMKEGGINASEGANALKSGLASMINPSKKTSEFLAELGINIKGIVNANAGDLKGTVVGFARALDTLDPLNRARAIEQLFGKFQFSRLSTLFQNVTKDSSQASRALGLAGASVEELAILSERELGKVENAVGIKFQKSIENLKQQLVPVGKAFLEALTPIVNFFGGLLEKFGNFSDGTKKALAIVVATVGAIAPVALMTFGVLVNGIANSIKFFAMLRSGMAKLNGQNQVLGGGFDYLTQAEIENMTETNALHMSHKTLIDTFNVEAGSVNALAAAYANAGSQARTLAATAPSFFNSSVTAAGAVSKLPKFAKGGVVPGTGNKDTVAAMLTPGEVVLTKDTVKNNPELVAALQNDSVKKYNDGTGGGSADISARLREEFVKNGNGTPEFKGRIKTLIDGAMSETQTGVRRVISFAAASGVEIAAENKEAIEYWRTEMLKAVEEAGNVLVNQIDLTRDQIKDRLKEMSPIPGTQAEGARNTFDLIDKHGNQNAAETFGHLTEGVRMSGSDARSKMKPGSKQSSEILANEMAAEYLNNLPDTDRRKPKTPIVPEYNVVSGLGIDGMTQETNTLLKNGTKNTQEFVDELSNLEPVRAWDTLMKQNGLTLEEHGQDVEVLHRKLVALILELKKTKAEISDADVTQAVSGLRNDPEVSPAIKDSLARSENMITAARLSGVSSEDAQNMQDVIRRGEVVVPGLKKPEKFKIAKSGSAQGGESTSNRIKGVGFYNQEEEDLRAAGEKLGSATIKGVRGKGGTAAESPSKKGIEAGKEVGEGLVIGLEQSEASVKAQSSQLGSSAIPDGNVKDMPIGVLVDNTEESAAIVEDSVDILSENNNNLISTTDLNEAISNDTAELEIENSEAVAKQKQLNELRDQELLARQRAAQNARDAAAASNPPVTSQSDAVAGDVGFIPSPAEQEREARNKLRIEKKLKLQEQRGLRREAVGKYSGKAAGALGTAAMVAGMAGAPAQVTGALGGASMLTSIAPAIAGLSGPQGLVVALAAAGAGAYLLNKKFTATAEAIAKFTRETTVSTSLLKKIGEQTGKVGASEIMDRRRGAGSLNTYIETGRKSTKEATQFLEGEAGKALQNVFTNNATKNGMAVASEQFALQIAAAISDGTIPEYLGSEIAYQMGVNLQDSVSGMRIDAEIRKLIGPKGENLVTDPLNVRARISDAASSRSNDLFDKMNSERSNTTGFARTGLLGDASGADKAAGLAVTGASAIETAQAQADAMQLYYDAQLKTLNNEMLATTNKAKQAEIQQKIIAMTAEQEAGMARMNNLVAAQLVRQEKIAASIIAQGSSKQGSSTGDDMSRSVWWNDGARREDAFFDAQKADVKAKFKGTAQEAAAQRVLNLGARADEDKSFANKGEGRTFEAKVNFLMQSGQMNPDQIESMMKIFQGNLKAMDVALNVGIRTHGGQKMAELATMLTGVEKKKAQRIIVQMARKNPAEFDKVGRALAILQRSDGMEVDMEAFLSVNGMERLEKLSAKLDNLEKLKSPLTKEVVIQFGKDNSVDIEGIIANWDYFGELDPEIQKEAIATYTTLFTTMTSFGSEAERLAWATAQAEMAAASKGDANSKAYKKEYETVLKLLTVGADGKPLPLNDYQTAMDYATKGTKAIHGSTAEIANKTAAVDGTEKDKADKKDPLDFLDSLAMRIKNVRDGAFDATNPLKSMMAAFSGKQAQKDVSKMFTLFDGLQQRMIKMGVPKEFREMIAGMSAEDFKAFASLPKGKNMFTYEKGKSKTKANITGLTKEGKAVMQTYREAQVGEFQVVQKEIVASVKEQDKAFKLLVGSGMSAADALLVVEDKAIAASIAAGAVGKKGSKEMKEFIADTKLANDALSVQAAFNKARKSNAEFAILKNAPELAKNMKAAGYSSEQIESALSDPDIAKYLLEDLKDGAIAAGDMKDYIDSIAQRQSIDIKIGLASGDWGKVTDAGRQLVDEMFAAQEALIRTGAKGQEINTNNLKISDLEQQISPFQTKINEINQSLAKNQRSIEITYTRPIEVLQTAIEGLDRQLETSPIFGNRLMEKIQEQNTMYSNDLAVISYESGKINEAYDKQLEALSQTKELNADIIAQQGRQLNLADALTQGDIAAAAKAAQDIKAANAARFADAQQTAMERARDNALGALKGPQSGMTQKQIEEAQYQNSQRLYAIETNPARVAILNQIKAKQDEIYTLEQAKSTLLTTIRGQEDEIYNIQNDSILPLQNQIDKLVLRNSQLQASIDKEVSAIEVLGKNRDAWNAVNAKIDAAKFASKDLDTAFAGLLAGVTAIDSMWKNVLDKMKSYSGVPLSVTAEQKNLTGNTKPTTTTPEADAAAAKANAMVDFALASTGAQVNTAVSNAVKAGLTPSVIANAMVPALINSGMDAAGAASSARYTGQALQYQAAEAAKAKAEAAKLGTPFGQAAVEKKLSKVGFLSSGGFVPKYFASGGFAKGSDTVPAMLTPGEFVMSKYSVQTHGIDKMRAINNGSTSMGDSVYNYNLSVNVKSDANPDQIAQAVMTQIRNIDSQRIRGSRI